MLAEICVHFEDIVSCLGFDSSMRIGAAFCSAIAGFPSRFRHFNVFNNGEYVFLPFFRNSFIDNRGYCGWSVIHEGQNVIDFISEQ